MLSPAWIIAAFRNCGLYVGLKRLPNGEKGILIRPKDRLGEEEIEAIKANRKGIIALLEKEIKSEIVTLRCGIAMIVYGRTDEELAENVAETHRIGLGPMFN